LLEADEQAIGLLLRAEGVLVNHRAPPCPPARGGGAQLPWSDRNCSASVATRSSPWPCWPGPAALRALTRTATPPDRCLNPARAVCRTVGAAARPVGPACRSGVSGDVPVARNRQGSMRDAQDHATAYLHRPRRAARRVGGALAQR